MHKTSKDMKQLLWITGVSVVLTAGVMAAALLLLASCTQDDGGTSAGTGSDPNLRVPLTVSTVSLAGGGGSNADTRTSTDTRSNANTRAASLPVPVISGKLGVGVRATTDYAAQSLIYTYTNGVWTTPTPLMLSTAPVSLYAYYPQGGIHSVAADGSVTLTTQLYSTANDFAYTTGGGENVCSTHPYAGFVLRHAYARIKVDIEFSDFFKGTTTLDAVTLAATGFLKSGTLNVNTNASTSGTTLDKLEWKPNQNLTTLNYKYLGDMLVVPSPLGTLSAAKLTITIDGANWNVDLSKALTKIEAGKSYRIRVVMGAVLIIDGVDMEGWDEGGSSNADSSFETGIPPVIDNVTNEGWTESNAGSGDTEFE